MSNEQNMEFFFSCAKGLEPFLIKEFKEFFDEEKYPEVKYLESMGGISVSATFLNAFEFSLHTKVTSRFFVKIGFFPFQHEQKIAKAAEKEIKQNEWHKYFLKNDRIKIETLFDPIVKNKIKSPLFCSQNLKDAICDHINLGIKSDPKNANYHLMQRIEWHRKKETYFSIVYVDLFARPLGNRGYKEEISHLAPLRESLAAAMILSTEWDKKEVFFDPMCGSGTFLIEAFFQKFKVSPQIFYLLKSIGGKPILSVLVSKRRLSLFTTELSKIENILKLELKKFYDAIEVKNLSIFGSDIFFENIKAFDKFLSRFQLKNVIKVEQKDFFKTRDRSEDGGMIIFNPPYGKRLKHTMPNKRNENNEVNKLQQDNQEDDKINDFYHKIGEHLKQNFKGYNAYILMGDNIQRKSISLQTKSRQIFFNGKIECRLIKYELY